MFGTGAVFLSFDFVNSQFQGHSLTGVEKDQKNDLIQIPGPHFAEEVPEAQRG